MDLHGETAARYVRAFLCNPNGINTRAVTRDALAACRSEHARRRLSLAGVARRTVPVVNQPQFYAGARARQKQRPVTATVRGAAVTHTGTPPRPAGAV